MKWRCEWCGKPHERNDPPCDNCGHHAFEKAVVPQAPEVDDDYEVIEWVCTECGRAHQRNSPPCSRCGNTSLEKNVVEFDDAELAGASYADLVTPGYLVAAAVALVVLLAFLLQVLGVVSVPFLEFGPTPVEDAPGNATAAAGMAFAPVERAFVDAVNDRRERNGTDRLTTDPGLTDAADYYNRRIVILVNSDDGERPRLRDALEARDATCEGDPFVTTFRTAGPAPGTDPMEYGERLASTLLAEEDRGLGANYSTIGVDLHAGPDGDVFVTRIVC